MTTSPTLKPKPSGRTREFRQRLIPYLIALRPQNAAYSAIGEILAALERAEVEVTGKARGWAMGRSAGCNARGRE